MKLTIVSADRTIHFFTTYVTQTGRLDAGNDAKTCNVIAYDYIIIVGGLYGHVGENADSNRCHRGKEFGGRNEGDYILIKRRHFTTDLTTDYKAGPYETIAPQH